MTSYTPVRPNAPVRRDDDAAAGIDITDDFEPFEQRNDIFSRAFWDSKVQSKHTDAFFASHRAGASPRRGEGFTQKDFALRNAAWFVSDLISKRSVEAGVREGFQAAIRADTPVADTAVQVEDSHAAAQDIKKVARFFGADLCGITDMDPRWLYTARVDTRDMSSAPHDLPPALMQACAQGQASVIVLGHAMDQDLVATYPSALASASAGREYSHEACIVMQLAAYIRNLGYEAVASMNDTGLAIPYAIKAGLGEYARNQMVITPQFGPRLRFSKIFTTMPLQQDAPKPQGVAAFCNICTRCADACPVKALPYGAPSDHQPNVSAIKGVRKWTSDAEKCFSFWAKLASDCAICMRVCPFNRDYRRWYNRLWRRVACSPARRLALWLARGHGMRQKPSAWWQK